MAQNIIAQVLGGSKTVFDGVATVADVKAKLNLDGKYQASVNGEVESDDYQLEDTDHVTFTRQVKGG